VLGELYLSSPNTDLTALQRELAGQPSSFPTRAPKDDDDEDEPPAASWLGDDEDDDWAASR
jgi:hypothetical protein